MRARKVALLSLLALLFPLVGAAQITVSIDTTIADKNCSDFGSILEAQGTYLAMQVLVQDSTADPFGLDADGDGIACASKDVVRRIAPGDTTGFWYETVEKVEDAKCPAVDEPFAVDDVLGDIRGLPREVMSDSTEYASLQSKVTCLRNLGLLSEGIPIPSPPPPDTGDGEENVAPTVGSVSIDTVGTPGDDDADFDVYWSVADENGNLDTIQFELWNLGTDEVVDSGTYDAGQWGDGSEASNNQGSPFRFLAPGEDGSGDTYEIRLTAVDSTGAAASGSAQVTEEFVEENLAPVVDSVTIDTAASTGPDARFNVTWGASDPNGNLDSLEFELWNVTTGQIRDEATVPAENWGDGEAASNDPGEPFTFVSAGEDGSGDTYEIRITAIDADGAEASGSAQVTEETEQENLAPVVDSLTIDTAEAQSSAAHFDVTWGVSDVNANLDSLNFEIWNVTQGQKKKDVSFDPMDWGDGASASNTPGQPFRFTVEQEDGSGDTYEVRLTVYDAAGLTGADSAQVVEEFEEENLAPAIDSVTIDTAAHPSDNAHFDVTWGASDPNGNLDSLHYELWNLTTGQMRDEATFPAEQWGDGQSASNNPGEPFRFVSGGEDGSGDTYEIRITATDSAGAEASGSAQVVEEFEEENLAPVVDSVTIDTAASTGSDARFNVTWGASDGNGNLDSLRFELWNVTTGQMRDESTVPAENWGDGDAAANDPGEPFTFASAGEDGSGDTYEIRITATDSAGAEASGSAQVVEEFEEENLAPVVDSLSIFPVDMPDGDADFDVRWGASDADGNLNVIQFELYNATTGDLRVDSTLEAGNWGDGQSASNDPGTPLRLVSEGEEGSGDTYEVRMFAVDSLGAEASDSAQAVEDDVVPGDEPSFIYAQECYTHVDNATVNSPDSQVLPGGQQIAEDDTIAAVSPRGNCVGHISASGGGTFTLAVASKNDTTLGLPDDPGMYEGEDFSFEIYDVSEGIAYSMWPVFTPCEEVDMEICRDSGGYEDDVFFEVDSLQQEKPSYEDTTNVTGSLTVGVTTTYPYDESNPALQSCGPESPDEVAEIDAARARKYSNDGTDWVRRDTTTARGNGYALAVPESPEGQPLPQKRDGATFSVPVDFCATGPHYLWVRAAHVGDGGGANSFHVRDPTDTWHSYNDIYDGGSLADAPAGEWVWVNTGGSTVGETEQGPMVLEVPSTGLGKLLFRMREGGIRIDEIHLTTSGDYSPF